MVTIKEWFAPQRVLSKLGAYSFNQSVFKDETMYPNKEMDECIKLYEQRPQINSGIKQYCRFLFGKGLRAVSNDKMSKQWLHQWMIERDRFKNEVFNFIISAVVTGQGYFELTYNQKNNGTMVLDNVYNIPDSSRLFMNLHQTEEEQQTGRNFWIYQIPMRLRNFSFQNISYKPRMWRVSFIRGDAVFTQMVYGIGVDFNKIACFRNGWSRDGLYGRSFLASAIDDGDIVAEILKNLAIIARKRALNAKFISVGTIEDPATDEDIELLDTQIKDRDEDAHILVNKQINAVDFEHQGKYDKMTETLDFLRKDISSGLVPNYITPWNSEVNRATASQTKVPFQLELDSVREDIELFINRLVVDNLKKEYPFLAKDLRLEFIHVDLDTMEDKMQFGPQLYQTDIITLNEYRELLGMDRVNDGDKYYSQRQQLQSQMNNEAPNVQLPQQSQASFTENVDNSDIDFLNEDQVYEELISLAKRAKEMMKKFKIGEKISKLKWGNDKERLVSTLRKVMEEVLKLESPKVYDLKDKLETAVKGEEFDKTDFVRVARTELNSMRAANAVLNFKEAGLTKYKFVAKIDNKTSPKCREYNGQVFKVEDGLLGKAPVPSLHPNCRSRIVPAW